MKRHRQYVCLLLQVVFFIASCLAENLLLDINFKNPIAVTDHAFLSFTLDPATLRNDAFTKNIERSTNMARGLAPAYIRLGGPQSNSYNFERAYSHEIDTNPHDMHFGKKWTLIQQWAKNAELDVIACITPQYINNESKTHPKDPRNIAELLSFSDRMGYNISWQLGYECQTRCDLSGEELGRYVVNLREMLNTFPRYSNSLITGPDIVAYKTTQQQKYLQNYLHSANAALSAITWHPDLASVFLNNNSTSMHYDNMIAEKDEMYKIISHTTERKPLWIAESKSEECKHQYLGALTWTRRLGNAAKLGVQVMMRQLSDLSKATPDYWVSLLYKTLVGREVLEMRFQSNNESYVHFYSQCTKPSALYSKGAITIFGINLTPKKVTASLKNLKIKILHKYILSPNSETGNKMFSEKVLLNNKPLNLINDEKLPDINPEIIIDPDGLELELSSGEIGFWIIPNAKVEVCICSEEETTENTIVKKLSKRQDNQEENITQSNVIDIKNSKIYAKKDRRKQKHVGNTKTESQQKVWSSKLLARIKKILQKRLQKKENNESPNLQRSLRIVSEKKQGNSSEESEEQQNVDNQNFEKVDIFSHLEIIRDKLAKFKHILLEKKAQMDIQDFRSEIQSIDNAVTLISKIDTLFLKLVSNESTMNKIKDKAKNKEIVEICKTEEYVREYLIELENSAKKRTNTFKKIEKYFNKLHNLLKDNDNNDSTKNSKNSQDSVDKDLMEGKRFKRYLDRKSENFEKIRMLKKRSRIDDLKNHVTKQKVTGENDERKKFILSNNVNNSIKGFNNNKNKYNKLRRDIVKRFIKSDIFENAVHHINYQHLVQKHKIIKKDDIYRKRSKIGDMEDYQSSVQKPKRTKRNVNKKLVEIGSRKESISRKHPRIGDLKNYENERKTKQKSDTRKEGLLVPFNPRITDSDENNFYGFFRRNPVKGFPESDIFLTTGDSSEQNDNGYDYVEDEDNADDGSKRKNTQHNQKLMLDRMEDNTWVEKVEDDHCDYMPNEFFENIKLSNTKTKESSKNYDDLWEAEVLPEEHKNNKDNNNNKTTVAEVIQEQLHNEEEEKREKSMQKFVNYYDDSEKQEHDWDAKYEALGLASKSSSMPSDQLLKTPIYTNQASNVGLEDTKLEMEPGSKLSNSFYPPSQDRDNINVKTTQYSKSANMYAEYPTRDKILHNRRNKRSNWEELRNVLAEEMIKEDEENTKDCHCRVIRASNSPKKLCYCRVKRDNPVLIAQVADTSSKIESMNRDTAQSKKNVQNSMTREEYEEIMAGEMLPNTSVTEPDYEENGTTTESVITELSTLDHKLSSTTQTIDVISTSGVDNISEQYHNTKISTTNPSSVNSTSELSLSNNNTVAYVAKEKFFRTQTPDVQPKNKTTTYDYLQVTSTVPSENKNNREESTVSATKNSVQEKTCGKIQDLINEKEKAERRSSTYPTITKDQENEEGHDNSYKTGLKSTNSLKEITKSIVEQQVTTEIILSKRAASIASDNSKSNESKTKSNALLQSEEDTQNSESEARPQLRKDANTRRLKTMSENLPRESLEGLARYEKYLMGRTEQIDKRKKKLYARREKLLHQYQDELTKVANEQKRNLKRREAWEKLRESDDFRRLIDQGEFIGVLMDDDITYEDDDDESYSIPIELVPKQRNGIVDQIYLLAKAKIIRYPEHNEYYQFLRNLKVIEDDEELAETSRSSGRKHNQYYELLPKIIEDKQDVAEASRFLDRKNNQDCQYPFKSVEDKRESTETTPKSLDRKVFIIDPSTYYGGEPNLQSHEDYLKLPKYHLKIKSQIQDPTPRWILKNFHQVLSKSKSSESQHQVPKLQKYVKKSPIKDYHDQANANILYILDTQRQYDLPKKLTQDWLSSYDRRDVDQAVCNKETNKLNDIYKNLKPDKDNLDSTFTINKKIRFMGNKEFANSNNRKKDTLDSGTIEGIKGAEEVIRSKKSENVELTKEDIIKDKIVENAEEINKSYSPNDTTENNLNIKMYNNNEAVENVEKINDDDPKAKELRKGHMRIRRDTGKQTDDEERLPYFLLTARNGLNRDMRVRLMKDSKEIFNKQPILLTKKYRPSSAGLYQKSRNYLVSSRSDIKVDRENEKEHRSNYIILIPIKIKNIYPYKILEVKDNDDSLEHFEIPAKWDNQYTSEKVSGSMNKYLNNESDEFEDLSNLQSIESTENIPNEENCSSESKEDVSIDVEDSEAESEKEDEQYINKNEIDKYLETKDQIESNEHGMFLLLPWKNVKKRQRRQIESNINDGSIQIKHEITRQSQPNKSISTEDVENKRNGEHYLNKNIHKEEEENMIEMMNDIRAYYLKPQTNRKNRDDLLEDFIRARKKNNLYNNKVFSAKNNEIIENIPLNNIPKSDKKLLQEAIPKLQNAIIDDLEKTQDHKKSMEEFVNDSEENFNNTLTSDEDKYHENGTSGITGNAFHIAIMNIKKFFTLFSKISRIFTYKF